MEMAVTTGAESLRTTDGVIALQNLTAQINGLARQASRGSSNVASRIHLIELIALRGHVLGRITDAERASELAEQLVRDAPKDGLALLVRARTHIYFHHFVAGMIDLNEAERLGVDSAQVDPERAAIFQATGRSDDALALALAATGRRPDFATVGTLAGLHAERGETAEAERLYDESQKRYRGVSPFALAALEYQRGRMWMRRGDLSRGRVWLAAAVQRVPAYAPAQGQIAEIEAALGEVDAAIARLGPLTAFADDPDYAARLAYVLVEAGREGEAQTWRGRASVRYEELVAHHPEAYKDHAAEFWQKIGRDPARVLELVSLPALANGPAEHGAHDRVVAALDQIRWRDTSARYQSNRPSSRTNNVRLS